MIDVRRLSTFNRMAKEGAEQVADHLNQMTGLNSQMEITKINFLDVEDLEKHLGDETKVGLQIQLTKPPHGYVLILFNEDTAHKLADILLAGMDGGGEDGEFGDMEQSAVMEMGNIMTSGFIDGWANVLGTTIDMSTPEFKHGAGRNMVGDVVGASDDEIAMFFDSQVHGPDSEIEAQIYAFPVLEELVDLMNRLEI